MSSSSSPPPTAPVPARWKPILAILGVLVSLILIIKKGGVGPRDALAYAGVLILIIIGLSVLHRRISAPGKFLDFLANTVYALVVLVLILFVTCAFLDKPKPLPELLQSLGIQATKVREKPTVELRSNGEQQATVEKEALVNSILERLQRARVTEWKALAAARNEKWRNGVTFEGQDKFEIDLVDDEPEFSVTESSWGFHNMRGGPFAALYVIHDSDPKLLGLTLVTAPDGGKSKPDNGNGFARFSITTHENPTTIVCRERTYVLIERTPAQEEYVKGPDNKPVPYPGGTPGTYKTVLRKHGTLTVRGVAPRLLIADTNNPPQEWKPVRSADELQKMSLEELRLLK